MIILILSIGSKRVFIPADDRRRFTAHFLNFQLVFFTSMVTKLVVNRKMIKK